MSSALIVSVERHDVPQAEAGLVPNTYAYESAPMVKPTGFREYDARWLFGEEINLMGVQALGLGLGTLLRRARRAAGDRRPATISAPIPSSIKYALIVGPDGGGRAGCTTSASRVTPMAYFAQFALDVPGRRDGHGLAQRQRLDRRQDGRAAPRHLRAGRDGPRCSDIVLGGSFRTAPTAAPIEFVENFPSRYIADLTDRPKLKRKLKVVARLRQRHGRRLRAAAAGGARRRGRAARLRARLHLPALQPQPRRPARCCTPWPRRCRRHGADVGLGFDGDGDRCGVVDNEGDEIFADKIGVMLARDLSTLHPGATFVVDVKSTGLFATDPVLQAHGVKADYWKTGHSYIKRRVHDLKALAGFEKSGHFFFNAPVGRGYDDGLVTAIAVLDMLDRNPGKSMADLYRDAAQDLGLADHVAALRRRDEIRRRRRGRRAFQAMQAAGETPRRASRSATSSRSTACASRSRTAPGAWCAPPRTSPNSWSWSRARCRRRACARCSRRSTPCCARTRRSEGIQIKTKFEHNAVKAYRAEVPT